MSDGHEEACDKLSAEIEKIQGIIDKERGTMKGDVCCDKCTDYIGYGWDVKRHEVKLVGDVYATLCTPCRNLWGDHLLVEVGEAQETYEKFKKVESKLKTAELCFHTSGGDKVPEAELAMEPLIAEREAIRLDLRRLSRVWLADVIVPANAAVTTP